MAMLLLCVLYALTPDHSHRRIQTNRRRNRWNNNNNDITKIKEEIISNEAKKKIFDVNTLHYYIWMHHYTHGTPIKLQNPYKYFFYSQIRKFEGKK